MQPINIFSCDSSSIVSNVGRSVGRSVGRLVGWSVTNEFKKLIAIEYAQLEASSSHSSFNSSSNYSSSNSSSSSHVVSCCRSSIGRNVCRLVNL